MTESKALDTAEAIVHPVTFAEALRVWIRISLLSFGGPAGQIALMHRHFKKATTSRLSCRDVLSSAAARAVLVILVEFGLWPREAT